MVLSQFSDSGGRATLADYIALENVYPAGRLDYDSEGLLLLCDDGRLQARISHPRYKMRKYYWAQVEGIVDDAALGRLRNGLELKDGLAVALSARRIEEPPLWPRQPPIRERQQVPTCWLEICIDQGRNRQVRRMTAAMGYPTLRLVRWRVGDWSIDGIEPGAYQRLELNLAARKRRQRRPKRAP
jgi:23S rRNA pseudouridine2457 synthase